MTAEGPGLDVVGLTEGCGDIAEGVGALPVPHLDGPAGGPGEEPVFGVDLCPGTGAEGGPLQIGAGHPAVGPGEEPGLGPDLHPGTGAEGGPLHIGTVQPGQE